MMISESGAARDAPGPKLMTRTRNPLSLGSVSRPGRCVMRASHGGGSESWVEQHWVQLWLPPGPRPAMARPRGPGGFFSERNSNRWSVAACGPARLTPSGPGPGAPLIMGFIMG
jgi:hypothetical protein